MRFMSCFLLLSLCFLATETFAVEIPPSPAGGGWFQIYAPGDFAFAADHRDFDINLQKNGFTIEAWIYVTRPIKPFVWAENPAEQKLQDLWVVFEKAGSYRLFILSNHRARFLLWGPGFTHTFSFPGHRLQVNQWHYLAVMFAEDYYQLVVDNRLLGSLYLNGKGLQDLNNTDGVFSIGGGKEPLNGNIDKRWLWNPFPAGLIDEVRISNIIRYPKDEINANEWNDVIEIPKVPYEKDEHTIALWHFDFEKLGDSRWSDASGNGHHLRYKGDYLGVQPQNRLTTMWGKLKEWGKLKGR